jgi:hypothetical protein
MGSKHPWCEACVAPHSPKDCVVAQRMPQEEEKQHDEEEEDHTIYMASHKFCQ